MTLPTVASPPLVPLTVAQRHLQAARMTLPTVASPPLVPLTVAQRHFLALHTTRHPDRWQWHFMDTQLRATSGRHTATIWRDELDDLVQRGLMERGMGFDVRVTQEGRAAVAAERERI